MLVDLPYPHAVLTVLCLVPAVDNWLSGRSLRAFLNDPLLPERLLAHRRRGRIALWSVVAGCFLLGRFEDLVWTLPLTFAARAAAAYPLRRALYDERWSFAGYMAGICRLLLALVGFRLLLAFVPMIVSAAGSWDWIAAMAIAALPPPWRNRSADWFRCLGAPTPPGDGRPRARFQAPAAASPAPQPRFELIDLRGGAIANAAALPSRRGSSVLYTDTLLRLLDLDEAAAITAHEIAHLEYYDASRLRTLNRILT